METYQVKKWTAKNIEVRVPGSKSITNRALMLAAMGNCKCTLDGVLFSDDSRAFLDCLNRLGFALQVDEDAKRVTIEGTGGAVPNAHGTAINVRSAGTAARFMTVLLAVCGGSYQLESSEQMAKRPMEPLLSVLRTAGAEITCNRQEGHFPFCLEAEPAKMQMEDIVIDTTVSSQFASALLMAGCLLPKGLTLTLTGDRPAGSYIKMTLSMLTQFGICFEELPANAGEKKYHIPGGQSYGLSHYRIEPDLSAAAYFYSLAPLFGIRALVRDVHMPSLQGDIRYPQLLEKLGCVLEETESGLALTGQGTTYPGLSVNMKDFSDQALTFSVVAAFATSPSRITGIGHIRAQECDRMEAIISQLGKLGASCSIIEDGDGILIHPIGEEDRAASFDVSIETFEDHRVAMSMTLAGLKREGVTILNPMCCKKTFENYFAVIDSLYES